MISFLYFTKVFLKSKFLIFRGTHFLFWREADGTFDTPTTMSSIGEHSSRLVFLYFCIFAFLYFCITFVTCFSPQENTCLTFGKSVGRINLSMILFHVGPKTKCKYQQYPL